MITTIVMGIKDEIKQSHFKSNGHMAIVNLLFTSNWLRDQQQITFKKHGILAQHYNILRIVKGKKSAPAYPGEIKNVMLDKGRDLTRLIDKLVTLQLLDRRVCKINRRKVEIFITQKGLQLADLIEKETSENTTTIFKLNEEESLQLSNLLDKLRG